MTPRLFFRYFSTRRLFDWVDFTRDLQCDRPHVSTVRRGPKEAGAALDASSFEVFDNRERLREHVRPVLERRDEAIRIDRAIHRRKLLAATLERDEPPHTRKAVP